MATGILLNHLDITAVNALLIWLWKDPTWNAKKSRLFFYENCQVCANPTTNGTSSNATGNVFGRKLSGEGICSRKCPGVMYVGIVRAGKYAEKKTSREKCLDPHEGLQVCTRL